MQAIQVNNRLDELFKQKDRALLNVYFTAGYPQLHDTLPILRALENAGADIVEIGIPFSDPLADGETIQQSSQTAIANGMTLTLLFEQLQHMRKEIKLPVLLMGYFNSVLQFGIEHFCRACAKVGVDGIILPDLPMQEYLEEYKDMFDAHGLHNIFLITPQTAEARIKRIDEVSSGFIYMVSSASTTGAKSGISTDQQAYFERVSRLQLRSPRLIGFGISDNSSFQTACNYAHGAIVGSAFIKMITQSQNFEQDITDFVRSLKGTSI
jgi:tryptophan synthase alpha chain